MNDRRTHFHRELAALEADLVGVAGRAEGMIAEAIRAVVEDAPAVADAVIASDAEIDRIYLDIHDRWLELMARQQPMGSDLRLMSAILVLNATLERMGDQCVNISKMAKVVHGLPRSEQILEELQEMADLVRPMVRRSVAAFIRRDVAAALTLPEMDEPVDRLNRQMYQRVVACGPRKEQLEWATRMMMVARALERIGDQAVDVAEQVVFLATGEFREFGDTAGSGDRT